MATNEKWDSRSYRETAEGSQLTQVVLTTWDEWAEGYGTTTDGARFDFSVIGDYWVGSITRDDLYCTDIEIRPYNNNTDALITVIWSTEGFSAEKKRPDQKASWDEEMDVHLEMTTIGPNDSYYDHNAGDFQKWAAAFTSAPISGTLEDCPYLDAFTVNGVWTVRAYGSGAHYYRVLPYLGHINSGAMLRWYYNDKLDGERNDDIPSTWNDIGCWMFAGCRYRRLGTNKYEYEFNFMYRNTNTFNVPFGWDYFKYEDYTAADDTGHSQLYRYRSADLTQLWVGMDKEEPREALGVR